MLAITRMSHSNRTFIFIFNGLVHREYHAMENKCGTICQTNLNILHHNEDLHNQWYMPWFHIWSVIISLTPESAKRNTRLFGKNIT